MKIIECKDLTKEYISSDSTVKAVDNVSISFEQGEFCAVTGPSGSGKSTLSGGQQQRIAIARALANKPSILFADEPTGNLDKKSGQEVLSLLKYCAKEFGITLILVTHDLHVAEQADRILTIEDGKIVADTKAVAEN